MTPRVREILSWYGADGAGTLTNLARLLNHGRLAGTGKLVILPVDQGFEHGPARSFAPNPPAYDPLYHFELAIAAGCNAYAAPLGFLEAGAREFAGEIPLILKANNNDSLRDEKDPNQALTASVQDALRLGCCAVGLTIYPGSAHELNMYEQIRAYAEEAKRNGLAVVIWSYPRGSGLSKEGETAIDVVGYAVQIAAQLGAHIVKVKMLSAHIEQEAARKVYVERRIPIATPAERVRHVVDCAFAGRRIVIFSGGAAVSDDGKLLDEIRSIHAGGGFGSIIGRNSFQRTKAEALRMLGAVMDIYAAKPDRI
ncbi:MAG: class I fructose-bisphosphate aldolase [Beijerinckiaceae bacterium]